MNRSEFISYISHPEKLSGADTSTLSDLVKTFPYFQTAQLLYAKNLFNQNSIHYSNQLKIAAAYSGDRKVLYNLIHSKTQPTNENNLVVETVSQEKAVQEKLSEKPIQEVKQEKKVEPEIPKTSVVELEKEIMSEAISSYIEIEVEKEINQLDNTPTVVIKEDVLQESEPQTIDTNKKYGFGDWLKILDKSTPEVEKKQIVQDQSTQELIDQFIVEEPRISKPKAEFFSPVNLARKSVADDETMVSETLARIYEKQGHYPKAIKAYESLSLKYPEKKLFFAARIKELKENLIS